MAYRPDQDSADYKAGYEDGVRDKREQLKALVEEWRKPVDEPYPDDGALYRIWERQECADDLGRVLGNETEDGDG